MCVCKWVGNIRGRFFGWVLLFIGVFLSFSFTVLICFVVTIWPTQGKGQMGGWMVVDLLWASGCKIWEFSFDDVGTILAVDSSVVKLSV